MPGQSGADRAMSMRDIEDLDRAMAWLGSKPSTALVLGGGFIGIEVAENLVKRGLNVTLLQRGNQLMKNLDPEIDLDVVAGEPRSGDYRYAVNNSFGFGGHNVALAFGKY